MPGPDPPKTHHDMLMVFCAVCGHKKKKDQLRDISLHIAGLIQEKQNTLFDLKDDRFPKVICKTCRPKLTKQNCNLPEPPPFDQIQRSALRHVTLGYNTNQNCFMCRSIVTGKPGQIVDYRKIAKPINNVIAAACTILRHCLCPCPLCFQEHTGIGIKHSCIDGRGSVKLSRHGDYEPVPMGEYQRDPSS